MSVGTRSLPDGRDSTVDDICDFIVEYINSDVLVCSLTEPKYSSRVRPDRTSQGLLSDRHLIIAGKYALPLPDDVPLTMWVRRSIEGAETANERVHDILTVNNRMERVTQHVLSLRGCAARLWIIPRTAYLSTSSTLRSC